MMEFELQTSGELGDARTSSTRSRVSSAAIVKKTK